LLSNPGTQLTWTSPEEWLKAAHQLDARRSCLHTKQSCCHHVEALPLSLIPLCFDRATLADCLSLLQRGPPSFAQPPRGNRANAPHTPLIMAINNQLARLPASYRDP
jgi:hypothetical protein